MVRIGPQSRGSLRKDLVDVHYDSSSRGGPGLRPRPCAEVRHLPVEHGHAEHRRLHRLGPDHLAVHQGRLDGPPRDRQGRRQLGGPARRLGRLRRQGDRRPDDHLPVAAAHRLHRRLQPLQDPRWRGRRDRDLRRHRRHRHPDVHGRDDPGPARRLVDQATRRPVVAQDQAWVRDAGQQLLRRHLGHDPRGLRLLHHEPDRHVGRRPARRGRQLPRDQQRPAVHLDHHRAGQGAVPQQRPQPRRADAARPDRGQGERQVDPLPPRGQPGRGPRAAARLLAVRQGPGQGFRARRGDHPLLRRHPRDLLPVRARQAQAHPRDDGRRHDADLHQPDLRLRPRRPRGPGLDLRSPRVDGLGQLHRRHPLGRPRGRRVLPRRILPAQDRPERRRG